MIPRLKSSATDPQRLTACELVRQANQIELAKHLSCLANRKSAQPTLDGLAPIPPLRRIFTIYVPFVTSTEAS